MKKIISGILPIYAWIPTLICIVINLLAFYATRPIAANLYHYDLTLPLDRSIPFVPVFILIYIASFVQWGLGYIAVGRESREFCYKYLSAMIVLKIICAVIFVVLPTTMLRPEISSTDFFSGLVKFIYSADTPDNLFPSIHCAESLFFTVAFFESRKIPTACKWVNLVFTLLVFMTVVLVKQHVLLDIVGSLILVPAVILACRAFHSERIFSFLHKEKPMR